MPETPSDRLTLRLSPHGRLALEVSEDAPAVEPAVAARMTEAFARGAGDGLVQLGAGEIGSIVTPVFAWWRDVAARYVEMRCVGTEPASLSPTELATLALTAPVMPGAEYLTAETLAALWSELDVAFERQLAAADSGLEAFLKSYNAAWNVVGRVHFNLAENRRDPDAPFAFMATWTQRLSAHAGAQHSPLATALREYAGASKRTQLLSLLVPVQRAAESAPWLRELVDSGEIYHPLRWTARDASQFLASIPDLERAGVIVRMPATWGAKRPPRPKVTATVGARSPTVLGLNALLDFRVAVALEGETLREDEIESLLAQRDSLVFLRGRWVEIDRTRLERTLREFKEAEALAAREGLRFSDAMRLLAGVEIAGAPSSAGSADWSAVTAGPWLADKLRAMRAPGTAEADPGPALKAVLRPYQRAGVRWMQLLSELGLGSCLADDMGLGKTIQVLALLLLERSKTVPPSLIVAPASLLANWAAEVERFAPSLKTRIVHPSTLAASEIAALTPADFAGFDLAITSYGSVTRMPVFAATSWHFVVIDEAQAIKNRNAKQTHAVKALRANARIALTGTPVENHLGDLWSIFDFIDPGLLGNAAQFTKYAKTLSKREHNPYGPLRDLVRPYILRRMKTDRSVIADLPDKTELVAYCTLGRKQAALYEETVLDLADRLRATEGIERRGLVLATLLRLKQICNHPSQWLGDRRYDEAESGKFGRLRELAESAATRQEKMLVFTQFREMTGPLEAFLAGVFGRPGLILHGETPVKKRAALVSAFQEDETIPFFVLSLKAGGSGLTLTAASHVVHFDRWWNPAVENQATDRAFRIGQKKNVLVHKFVCRGTVEEKIDALIESKRNLSAELLASSGEIAMTEMKDDELLQLIALDLHAAMKE